MILGELRRIEALAKDQKISANDCQRHGNHKGIEIFRKSQVLSLLDWLSKTSRQVVIFLYKQRSN